MILTKAFLEKLIPAFAQELVSEETELNYEGHRFDAKLDKNEDDELIIVIKYKRSIREEFKRWCEQVDDDIFVEACEKFEELTGRALCEVEEAELYDLFKKVIQEIVKIKIENLNKKYLGD